MRKASLTLCAAVASLSSANAQHACDNLGGEGWRTVPSVETVSVTDGAPYQADGDWLVERVTTVLPFCNYINAAGNYSLLSYSLSPETRTERVTICRGATPVAPYTGTCPPK